MSELGSSMSFIKAEKIRALTVKLPNATVAPPYRNEL
jgi:hypothetical protein